MPGPDPAVICVLLPIMRSSGEKGVSFWKGPELLGEVEGKVEFWVDVKGPARL